MEMGIYKTDEHRQLELRRTDSYAVADITIQSTSNEIYYAHKIALTAGSPVLDNIITKHHSDSPIPIRADSFLCNSFLDLLYGTTVPIALNDFTEFVNVLIFYRVNYWCVFPKKKEKDETKVGSQSSATAMCSSQSTPDSTPERASSLKVKDDKNKAGPSKQRHKSESQMSTLGVSTTSSPEFAQCSPRKKKVIDPEPFILIGSEVPPPLIPRKKYEKSTRTWWSKRPVSPNTEESTTIDAEISKLNRQMRPDPIDPVGIEAMRIEAERIEAERIEAEKIEADRIAKGGKPDKSSKK